MKPPARQRRRTVRGLVLLPDPEGYRTEDGCWLIQRTGAFGKYVRWRLRWPAGFPGRPAEDLGTTHWTLAGCVRRIVQAVAAARAALHPSPTTTTAPAPSGQEES